MMMNWNDLKVILAIGREGSLSAASRALRSSHSTVFRQINAIEARLETRFFNRHPHGYELTEAGEAVVRVASGIEEQLLELSRKLQGNDLRLQGKIRLTAPEGVAQYLLSPLLASFHHMHPDIHIELIISNHNLQLDRHEADLALRVTGNPPPTSVGKKICDFNVAAYATDTYLAGKQDSELGEYDYVLTNIARDWCPRSVWKNRQKPKAVFTSESILAVVNAARDGMGAAILPCFVGDNEADLKRLSGPLPDMHSELWILTHADLRQTTRVRALMDHLYHGLREESSRIAVDAS